MWGLALAFLGAIGLSPMPLLASMIGTTEAALKLIVSILMGYPIAIVYLTYIRQNVSLRHLYFIITGLDMAFYNFGFSLYHNMVPVIVIYLTTMIVGVGKYHSIITFVFNMTYLLVGYWMTESEDYDITWTMPHCVLTLKMIALSFDMWDGDNLSKGKELSANSKKTALINRPSILELLGFVYFPACFLVGPIFSFQRYSEFIGDKYPLDKEVKVYESEALKRLIQGLLYLTAFQVGVSVFSMSFMLSDEFWETSIFYRHIYCGLWAHFALYKYISCWLITEASCIRIGLSYNGEEQVNGQTVSKWDGCNNIKLLRFESATKFHHYIESFNCNTNYFAAEYIYKRLKFLGNRNLSQFFTLLFLAVWHGIRSGYYITFFNEFMIIVMEKGLESMLVKTQMYHNMWSNNIVKYLIYIILKTYTIVFMGWSLVPFDVKIFSKWWSVYSSLYFSGFILFLPWTFVYQPALKEIFKVFNVARVKTTEDSR